MQIPFSKYTGCGNSFIIIDDRERRMAREASIIQQLCHPHFGIGADGLILVTGEWSLIFYNADGQEAEMCGNGVRCVARFIQDELNISNKKLQLKTAAGPIETETTDSTVKVRMPPVEKIERALQVGSFTGDFLNSGVPHFVTFIPDLQAVDIGKSGHEISHHPLFAPSRTNVNFATILSERTIKIRTFERGVEQETLACGTGATAAALASGLPSPVSVEVASGEVLTIEFPTTNQDIYLIGPATPLCSGHFQLPLPSFPLIGTPSFAYT